jgi:hypothetical protein
MSENTLKKIDTTIKSTTSGQCPYCHSQNIEYIDNKIKSFVINYYYSCDNCGCEFTEINTLPEYIETEGTADPEKYLRNILFVILFPFFFSLTRSALDQYLISPKRKII